MRQEDDRTTNDQVADEFTELDDRGPGWHALGRIEVPTGLPHPSFDDQD